MLNWKSVNITYLYDGTFDGLLTIIFDCFTKKELPSNIEAKGTYQTNLVDAFIIVETDLEKANRISSGVLKNISYDVFYNSYCAFLSCTPGKEMAILQYICHGFIVGPKVNNMLSISYVFNVSDMRKRVWLEAHRYKGLVRFISASDNIYYSIIHPDNDVIEILGKHFIQRLSTMNFIIVDKVRNKALLYNNTQLNHYEIMDVTNLEIPKVSEEEKLYQEMWKAFFKTIAIKERTNPKLQAGYMPRRYWKDLIEID